MPHNILDRLLRPLVRGAQTRRYPAQPLELPPAARGLPTLDTARCDANAACVSACPTGALVVDDGAWHLDAGRCVFCAACADACPAGAIAMSHDVELADRSRQALVVSREIRGVVR